MSVFTVCVSHKSIAAYDMSYVCSTSNAYVLHYNSKHKRGSIKGILILFSFCFNSDYGWRAAEQRGDTKAAA